MTILAAISIIVCQTVAELPAWTFDTEADVQAWVANGHLAEVTAEDGVVSAKAVDWDPFFTCKGIEFAATPWQFILLRIKADQPGNGEIFWSGETAGKYGGFAPEKRTSFKLKGNGSWEEVAVFPFWQTEGTIRQLRLDVYEGARFDLDAIQILEWGAGEPPVTEAFSWELAGDTSAWRIHPAADALLSPRLRLPIEDKGWVTLRLRSDREGPASILWNTEGTRGVQSQGFAVRGDNELRYYNVELQGHPAWTSPLVALGIRLPKEANVYIDSIQIADEPSGPPEVDVQYLGFENGANRPGRPATVLAQFWNHGGSAVQELTATLTLPEGLAWVETLPTQAITELDYDDQATLTWKVSAEAAGDYTVRLTAEGEGAPGTAQATLRFLPSLELPAASYVPEPRPVETQLDVCMYYFPGWHSDVRWDCIRRVAPVRKPLLGYYDEGNPECVDWQIKWAVENGITCFLVDWYWVQGSKSLEHWFEAYRKAKYRDQLEVAIMWANHNAPNTHSVEDWRNVTQEWIDRYFPLEGYYYVDGKPAVFIWSPHNIRRDLNGSEVVAKAFVESHEMARAAGYDGITFLAMFGHESAGGVKALLDEGYYGATNYHEWGKALELSDEPKRARHEDIATTVRKTWEEKVARCGELVYYPVVDTGWDSRPWHGDRSLVISGRTPERFESILGQAKAYCMEIGREFVVLGPANEWGEGSYVEPNTEFGFAMYEAVRRVFAQGDPASWPVNFGPADVGLGPYDFPPVPQTNTWTFDNHSGGWTRVMNVTEPVCEDGAIRFKTTSRDPAIMVGTHHLRAKRFAKLLIRMRLAGAIPEGDHGQLFFSVGGQAMTEATSFRFALETDGETHTYAIDLGTNPRWRSRISTLRLDPCGVKDVEVIIDEIRFE